MIDRKHHRTRYLNLSACETNRGTEAHVPVVLGLPPVTKFATPGKESEGALV
jgi:hypothetical protein